MLSPSWRKSANAGCYATWNVAVLCRLFWVVLPLTSFVSSARFGPNDASGKGWVRHGHTTVVMNSQTWTQKCELSPPDGAPQA